MSKGIKKLLLTSDDEFGYKIIGLCCFHQDFQLVFHLNKLLKIALRKQRDPFVMTSKKNGVLQQDSFFVYEDTSISMNYYLLNNKLVGNFIVPEQHQIDYFLFLEDDEMNRFDKIVEKIKKINIIVKMVDLTNSPIETLASIQFK